MKSDEDGLRTRRGRSATAIAVVGAIVVLVLAHVVVAGQVEIQTFRDRGKAYYEEKQYKNAVEVFGLVTRMQRAVAQDHLNLALAHYQNNDDAAAMRAVGHMLAASPKNPGGHYLQGLIHKRAGDMLAVTESMRTASRLDPTDPAIRYNLGAALASVGEEDEALAEFELVIAMGFDVGLQHYVSALYRHAQMLLRRGQTERAREELMFHPQQRGRLSQAARAPSALDASRHMNIVVPNISVSPPQPETGARVALHASRGGDIPLPTGAGIAVGDLDGDGSTDLVTTSAAGAVWLWRPSGYQRFPFKTPSGPAAIGDVDGDALPDLYVSHASGDRLYRNTGGDDAELLRPVEVSLPSGGQPTSVLLVDYDHDGDLDVLVTHGMGQPVRLLRNHGGVEFVDHAQEAQLGLAAGSLFSEWADFDGDNDVDLYMISEDGDALLFTNIRNGRFQEIGMAVGAAGPGDANSALIEDFDNNGTIDILLLGTGGITALRNKGNGTFLPIEVEGLTAVDGLTDLATDDFNNDGYLDLVVASPTGIRLLINSGPWQFEERLLIESAAGKLLSIDVDADGAADLILIEEGAVRWWRQEGPVDHWVAVALQGKKNNRQGIGATVEIKGEGLYQKRPLRRAPLRFGVAGRSTLDVIRVTWPNGIIQNMIDTPVDQSLLTEELERLEGSCPLLYTWDGTAWRFANEVLGVAPLGMPLAVDVVHPPDPDEYVPIPGSALVARNGQFEIRFTEELREVGYLDAVRLIAVDHKEGTRVITDERFAAPPHPEFRVFNVTNAQPVVVKDHAGVDWTQALRRLDGIRATPFELDRYDGLATEHSLELHLSAVKRSASVREPVRLFLTGWVYWAMGSINLAVDTDPLVEFIPVALEVPDGAGGWRTAIADIGLPNGKDSTLSIDLTSIIDRRDPRVRLKTTMQLYWDEISYVIGAEAEPWAPAGDWQGAWGVPKPGDIQLVGMWPEEPSPIQLRVLKPIAADLSFRGFSRLIRDADGYETFDYRAVQADAPWEQHRGHYTRYGPVGELIQDADDRFIILGTGDEVSIRFPQDFPPVLEGWTRDYLVYLNGWVKDGDLNTIHGDRVEPLPFHAMSGYPYRPDEAYPEVLRAYELRFNTRPARAINRPLH